MVLGRFIAAVLIARNLGPLGTGQLAYVTWVSDTLAVFCGLGIPASLTRFVAELKAEGSEAEATALARWCLPRYTALAVMTAGFVTILIPHHAPTSLDTALWPYVAVLFLLQAVAALSQAHIAGRQDFKSLAVNNAFGTVLLVTACPAGSWLFGIKGAITGYAISALPLCADIVRSSRPLFRKPVLTVLLQRRFLKYTVTIWSATVLSAAIWSRMEIFFIERYWGGAQVAMFTVGLTISGLATQGPLLLTGALLPHFADCYAKKNLAALDMVFGSSTRLFCFILFPLSIGLASIIPAVLPLLYGEAFRPAIANATLLTAASALAFSGLAAALANAMEKPHANAWTGAVAGAASLAASVIVIPTWGSWGAALSRTIIQFALVLALLTYIHRHLRCTVPVRALFTMALAAVLSCAHNFWLVRRYHPLIALSVGIPASIALYLIITKRLRVLEAPDINALERAARVLPCPLHDFGLLLVAMCATQPHRGRRSTK